MPLVLSMAMAMTMTMTMYRDKRSKLLPFEGYEGSVFGSSS